MQHIGTRTLSFFLAVGLLNSCGGSLDYQDGLLGNTEDTEFILQPGSEETPIAPSPTPLPTPTPSETSVAPQPTPTLSPSPNPSPVPSGIPTPEPSVSPSPTPSPAPSPVAGICARVYDLREVTAPVTGNQPPDRLPDYDTLDAVGFVELSRIHVSSRSYKKGIPGMTPALKEWFGLSFRGLLEIPVAGFYRFGVRSDDGSRLWIDGRAIVHNDGVHAARWAPSGQVYLSPGSHPIRLDYFQAKKGKIALQLYWIHPTTRRWHLVPTEAIRGFGHDEKGCL